MATLATAPRTSPLQVNIYDGTRQTVPGDVKILYTITDGNNQCLFRGDRPQGTIFNVPFYDNFGDNYTVLAFADGCDQAGFTPVACSPGVHQMVDVMLLKKNAGFNFAAAQWDKLAATNPLLSGILAHGADDDAAGRDRYTQLMENRAPVLACLLNITTAMASIQLRTGSPLQYFKELIWDDTMAQDRFYGWADHALYDEVKLAASHGVFSRELGFDLFHAGATHSYKQIQFGEANVQLTFHANDTKVIDGVTCIRMEPDIDYFKDLGAHALLEVVSNGISGSLTDPRQVYVLRWMAGRHAGVAEFSPPYVIA